MVGAILTPFFLSLLVEEVRLFLKTYLSDYYLYALVGMLGICILILSFIHFHDKGNTKNVIAQEDPNLREQLIQKLTELYKARFKEKMKGELRLDINLKLKYTTIGTSPERTEKLDFRSIVRFITDYDAAWRHALRYPIISSACKS